MNSIMSISDIEDGLDDELYLLNKRYGELTENPIYCSFVAVGSWKPFDIDKIYVHSKKIKIKTQL